MIEEWVNVEDNPLVIDIEINNQIGCLEKKKARGSCMGVVHASHNWDVCSTLSFVYSVVFVFECTQLCIHGKDY